MPETPGDIHERLLRAALEVVGAGGVANLTNRQVAAKAGVALGSLTYHFESQTQLLRESLELFIVEEAARLGELTRELGRAKLTVDQAVVGLEALLNQETERRRAKLELYLAASRDPDLRPAVVRCFAAYDDLAAAALASVGLKGPKRLAPLLVAIIDGLQLRRLANGEDALQVASPLKSLLKALKS